MNESQRTDVIIASQEKELPSTWTFVDLQGKLDCTYSVGYYKSPKARRHNAKEGWPPSPEENLERLQDAGMAMDRGIPRCSNCSGTWLCRLFRDVIAS